MDALHIWMLFINLFARIHTHNCWPRTIMMARPLILLCFLEICIVPLPIKLAQSQWTFHPFPFTCIGATEHVWVCLLQVPQSTFHRIYRAASTSTCWEECPAHISFWSPLLDSSLHHFLDSPLRSQLPHFPTRRCIDLFVYVGKCVRFPSALVIFKPFLGFIAIDYCGF